MRAPGTARHGPPRKALKATAPLVGDLYLFLIHRGTARASPAGVRSYRRLAVLVENSQHTALDHHFGSLDVDRFHFDVGGLQADLCALVVKALQRGLRAVHQGYHDLSLTGSASALDEYVVAAD